MENCVSLVRIEPNLSFLSFMETWKDVNLESDKPEFYHAFFFLQAMKSTVG